LIVVVVGATYLYRHFRQEENRRAAGRWMERHAATRWIVALTRRFRPELEFLWNRVTPGGTFGLEFTTLMAVLAVGLFVVIAYAVAVGHNPGPTPGDVTAAEIAERLRTGWLVHVAEVVTTLGAGPLVWGVTVVCGAFLAARRRWIELAVLVGGMLLTSIGVEVAKDAVGRPRPLDPLVGYSGSSYPSGHAAHSVLYVWLAVTIVMRLRRGMARAALVVVAGIVVTVLVGLSRVYLDVHYMSDVSGGWALGAACFSFAAALALVVGQVRQNPEQ
jgi:undecaprenyl-diphosphatase